MDFSDLQQEVYDRGFDYLDPDRLKRWINQVYLAISENERWPWDEKITTGTAPITITDLRAVTSVTDQTNKQILQWKDRAALLRADTDLTTTGTPLYWYQSYTSDDTEPRDDSQTIVKVYPANTSATIEVAYLKVNDEMTNDSDQPAFPARWHDIIVDGTVIKAYKDSDNFDAAAAAQAFFDEQLERMRDSILRNYDSTDFVDMSHSYDGGGYYF